MRPFDHIRMQIDSHYARESGALAGEFDSMDLRRYWWWQTPSSIKATIQEVLIDEHGNTQVLSDEREVEFYLNPKRYL